jgi:hypothetical protein
MLHLEPTYLRYIYDHSPIENFKILQNMGATIRMGKHGHRTPIEAFQGVFKELIKEMV